MMKLLIFSVCLTMQFIKSESACKIPGNLITDLDMKKLYGKWYNTYHIPNPYEVDFSGLFDIYGPSNESDGSIVTNMYVDRLKGRIILTGTTEVLNKSIVNITFKEGKLSSNPENVNEAGKKIQWKKLLALWSGHFPVMYTNYENILIYVNCNLGQQPLKYPLAWILFNTLNPEQDIVDKAFEVVEQNGFKKSQFENFYIRRTTHNEP